MGYFLRLTDLKLVEVKRVSLRVYEKSWLAAEENHSLGSTQDYVVIPLQRNIYCSAEDVKSTSTTVVLDEVLKYVSEKE